MIWFLLTHYRMGMQASHKLGLMDLNEFMPKLRWNAILNSWYQVNMIPWTSFETYVRKREHRSHHQKHLSLMIIPEHCYKRTRKPKGDIKSHISKLKKKLKKMEGFGLQTIPPLPFSFFFYSNQRRPSCLFSKKTKMSRPFKVVNLPITRFQLTSPLSPFFF